MELKKKLSKPAIQEYERYETYASEFYYPDQDWANKPYPYNPVPCVTTNPFVRC